MIVIRKVRFEFDMENEQFAFELYRRWDSFCRSGFIDVAERLLVSGDKPETMVHVGRLEVDLGTLMEDEFYVKFGVRLKERLEEVLRGVLRGSTGQQMQSYPIAREYYRQFLYYLLYGYTDWDSAEPFDLKKGVLRAVQEGTEEFRRFLLTEGHRENLRRRLIFRLEDEVLCSLVILTVGSEGDFVNHYTVFLIRNYSNIQSGSITIRNYRDTVWLLVLTYLWAVSRGPVGRKELLRYTLRGLAAHLGIQVYMLIQYLTRGVEELLMGDSIRHELLEMLAEIAWEEELNGWIQRVARDGVKDIPDKLLEKVFSPEMLRQGIGDGRDKQVWIKELRRLLADARRRQKILNGLKEEEIGALVMVLEPREGEFIVSYARALQMSKDKGSYEGKAGQEFRYVKWDFIFAVLLERPSGDWNRRQFVSEVLCRLAAHYGVDYGRLLEYFQKEQEGLPEWLIGVLFELETEGELKGVEVAGKSQEMIRPEFRQRYVRLLVHPLSCRQLLKSLGEENIRQLVGVVFPLEKGFILDYAQRLDVGKECGMFEGRAGREFSRLKWEFIFRLGLTHVFNRKYFTLGVLQELAAHYSLNMADLLDYFYQNLREEKSGEFPEIWEVISELWQDVQQKQTVLETELHQINDLEIRLQALEKYLLTGRRLMDSGSMYILFCDLKKEASEQLLERMKRLPVNLLKCKVEPDAEGVKFYAALLLWWLEAHPCPDPEGVALNGMLQAAFTGNGKIGVAELRQLLVCCLENRMCEFLNSKKALVSASSGKCVNDLNEIVRQDSGPQGSLKSELELRNEKTGESQKEEFCVEDLKHWLVNGNSGQHASFFNESWLANRRNCLQVLERLEGHLYPRLWIERTGNLEVRRLATEWFRLEKQIGRNNFGWQMLVRYTLPEYANFSLEELCQIFIRQLWNRLDERQKQRLSEMVKSGQAGGVMWECALSQLNCWQKQEMIRESPLRGVDCVETDELLLIPVKNSGLVLYSPWFVQLFERLGFLDETGKGFIGVEVQIRAIYVLQALVDGSEERMYEEQDLFLNRLLVGLPTEAALPVSIELTEQEKGLVDSLTENLRANWPKMKNTSLDGLRQSFLQREGVLEEEEKGWKLTVDPLGMDVLLDSLPWGFTMIKLPWMEKGVKVEWRG